MPDQVSTISYLGTFAIISTMVGEVCDREVAKYSFDSIENSSSNSSTGDDRKELDDIKLQIAVSLTLLVGVIEVCNMGFWIMYFWFGVCL